MENRRKYLNIAGLVLVVLALLIGAYKLAEYRTEAAEKRTEESVKESYRKGYT